jgi:hypothetical protein
VTSSSAVRIGRTILVLAACWLVPCVAVPGALAAGWWHVTAGTRPSAIAPGSAQNEVQEVSVAATGGEFALANLTPAQIENEEFEIEGVPQYAAFPVSASAATVQTGLEGIYGTGNVSVTGGPGDETGSSPYVITFKGAFEDTPVSIVNTELGTKFFGLEGQELAKESRKGQNDGEIYATAENVGSSSIDSRKAPVSIVDKLPPGVTAIGISATIPVLGEELNKRTSLPCSLETLSCTMEGVLLPYDDIELRVTVRAGGSANFGIANEVEVSGGKTEGTTVKRLIQVAAGAPSPGIEDFTMALEDEGGTPATQAGSHPYQMTTTLAFNQTADSHTLQQTRPSVTPVAAPRDVITKLPAGLLGNPTSLPVCPLSKFLTIINGEENLCPAQTAVGVAVVTANEISLIGTLTFTLPVFNVEPAPGEPARFGFFVKSSNTPVYLDTSVRTGGDYGITVSGNNISQAAAIASADVSIWGVPGDPRHDATRGWGCLGAARGAPHHQPCYAQEESLPRPFLSLPTSCEGPLTATMEADTWNDPGVFVLAQNATPIPATDGCGDVPFGPSLSVTPDSSATSSPLGLDVDLHVDQDAGEDATGLAPASVKSTTVVLPPGVVVNPAAAGGLQACSLEQVGLSLPSPAACPAAAKIGTVEVLTPLLSHAVPGAVYLAEQTANPFGSLLAMYLVLEDPASGVIVKLAGKVDADPITGRLTATFADTPQLPFEDVKVHFFDGPQAPLSSPDSCGTYSSLGSIAPWSTTGAQSVSSPFSVTEGRDGGPCPASQAFTPRLAAGSADSRAGSFSPFLTSLSREDGEQRIGGLSLHLPPGLSGVLSGIKLCGEAAASAGACGPESLIGQSSASVGVGSRPFTVQGGRVYLTGPYGGSPFGLSVTMPAKAGPFDLGTVVVRARIDVDPTTARLTVTTGEVPHILQGIQLQIRHIEVAIDRPGFTFNPTNCKPLPITATIGSVEGASAAVSEPFQAANCAVLKFAPKFAVSTSGKTSKANGASLNVKLTYPQGPFGPYANIARVKVDLPKALPSRLTTLQKACTAKQFEANPAGCPAASVIGHAKAVTPILPVPLEGPAYFVSHGGEAFPSLIMVLQGYGVTIDLVGTTFISKQGITSSTFKTVPDAPVGSFELNLPQGKYSALAANGNLCTSKLAMPTEFLAQNGMKINESTPVSVTGCAKAKALTRAQKLAVALRACKKKAKQKRAVCNTAARKRYGAQAKKRISGKTKKRS